MRTQHAHAAHLSLRAIVAQRPIHRTFDVMDRTFLHQIDRTLLRRKRRTREPHQILHADPRRRFQRQHRHFVAIPQMMMIGDHDAIAQPALAQRRLQIGHTLISAVRKIFARRDRWRRFAPPRLIFPCTQKRNLRLAIHHRRHRAAHRVVRQFYAFCAHQIAPIALARATSFTARCTTGGSIIFDPRLTTASPLLCASSKAATTRIAFSISAAVG